MKKSKRPYYSPSERSVATTVSSRSGYTCATASMYSGYSDKSDRDDRNVRSDHYRNPAYGKIKLGLKKSNPAAIVLWAFHKIPSRQGLTSRRVIGFLKQHYQTLDDPKRTGKSLSAMLRCAVEFGLLQKRNNRFFLVAKKR
ncbi:unnamed protein product [Arctia plantaginis]|uniref:Uncharacterized protein n=1 Tax=Arctia plantaginis TaxID=874455 RepID=A0A8S1ANG1_ARCPL|nr:unnamed protein product [Arctia plantaginis]CAB3255889.1 unnamed protein product [Arctia plantaginis]